MTNAPASPAFDARASISTALQLAIRRHDAACLAGDLDVEAIATEIAEALERDRQTHLSASPQHVMREGRQVEALNASNDV